MKRWEEEALREDKEYSNGQSQSPSYSKVPHYPFYLDLLGTALFFLLVLLLQVKSNCERDLLSLTHLQNLIVHIVIVIVKNVDLVLVILADVSDSFDLISDSFPQSKLICLLEKERDFSMSFDALDSGGAR